MQEGLVFLGAILTTIISVVTIAKFLFYTKSEVNGKIAEIKAESDKRDEILQEKLAHAYGDVKTLISDLKEKLFSTQLEGEKLAHSYSQEIYDRMNQNKQLFDEHNQAFMEAISTLKQETKQMANDFSALVNTIKDELKNDYISRYNELLALINTKVSSSDFDRLENKFDKVTETITELKTIVQLQLEEKK